MAANGLFPFICCYRKPLTSQIPKLERGRLRTRCCSTLQESHCSALLCTMLLLGPDRDLPALCIQIFADAPESCPVSPTASVFTAPTRQSKKQSRQSRPLAVYNPQALDIQKGRKCVHTQMYVGQ